MPTRNERHDLESPSAAEATSYRSAIRTAKAVVADIGEEAASGSAGLAELSRCKENNSERDAHTVIAKKFALALPIKVTILPKAAGVIYGGDIDVLSLRSWLEFMVTHNCWHILIGLKQPDPLREQAILREFWARYRNLKPAHRVFTLADQNKLDLSRCAPLLLHGDEGRGRKRCGFLVVSWLSYLGLGTAQANKNRKKRPFLSMRLNYGGSTFCHRLLTSVLPKMIRDEAALKDILAFIATDAVRMLEQGICINGVTYWAACLQCTGDWAWLVKAGSFSRSYSNCEKRARGKDSRPRGLCHLCRAGQIGVPFENYQSNTPAWESTMFEESPFAQTPSLNKIPYIEGEEPAFYTFDLFFSIASIWGLENASRLGSWLS